MNAQPTISVEELQFLLAFNDGHIAKFNSLSATKQKLALKLASYALVYSGNESNIEEELIGYVYISDKGRDCIEIMRVAATEYVKS